jgi:hypothetical protein
MIKIRSDYWRGHEKLAKIYRRLDIKDKEVYHLEQVIKHSWNQEKSLMKLKEIFKDSSSEKYF